MSWTVALLGGAACAGWGLAVALAVSARRRLALVADAEHELRGAVAAIGLAAERMARVGATAAFSSLVRLQLDRMAAGLEDLAAARRPPSGAPAPAGRPGPGGRPDLDPGRLAQVMGNLIANATEHGIGPVDVSSSRRAGAVRIEMRNRNRPPELDGWDAGRPGRGRGLAIAARAAGELGGRLRVESSAGETRAELELPAPAAGAGPGGEAAASSGGDAAAAGAGGEPAAAGSGGGAEAAASRGEREADGGETAPPAPEADASRAA